MERMVERMKNLGTALIELFNALDIESEKHRVGCGCNDECYYSYFPYLPHGAPLVYEG